MVAWVAGGEWEVLTVDPARHLRVGDVEEFGRLGDGYPPRGANRLRETRLTAVLMLPVEFTVDLVELVL